MTHQKLDTDQKALDINLNEKIYGTFAEIGAGQEVARYFFKVGAAAGTVAKTMSAYDKTVSDDIYGPERKGRYVCESRLYKMLDHEYDLIEKRLSEEKPNTNLFVFADTVSTIDYHKTVKGHGWLGIRFQLTPGGAPNDIVLHVKMLDNDYQLQQSAVGILGVNLIYGCYFYYNEPEVFLESLMDSLKGRIQIDLVRMTGPDLGQIDNRLLSLWSVKKGLTDVAIIAPNRQNIHASEFLYKKHVLVVRGSYRPMTLVNKDMIDKSNVQFKNEPEVDEDRTSLLTEITIDNLRQNGDLDNKDFIDRTEILCSMGHTVIVSNCGDYKKLIEYLSEYKIKNLGLVIGLNQLNELIKNLYEKNYKGRLLAAFGDIFLNNVRLYVYPVISVKDGQIKYCKDLPIPDRIQFLYKHLADNQEIKDVLGFNEENLTIFSKDVLSMIKTGEKNWEEKVPEAVAQLIKMKKLFGYNPE